MARNGLPTPMKFSAPGATIMGYNPVLGPEYRNMDKKQMARAAIEHGFSAPLRFPDGHPQLHILECGSCGTVRACSDSRYIPLLRRAHAATCANGFSHVVAASAA